MSARIAVIGSNGQLGSDLLRVGVEQGRKVVGLTHADIEITDAQSASKVLDQIMPDVVINKAAAHEDLGPLAKYQAFHYLPAHMPSRRLARRAGRSYYVLCLWF